MIKVAAEKDIHIMHQLMLEAFEEYRTLEFPSSALNETVSLILNSVRNDSEQAIIHFEEDIPIGSARFKMEDHYLYFSRVSVPSHARGQGVAKSMLIWLENHAKQDNKNEMRCKVRVSLPKNIQLYRSFGYSVIKEEIVTNPNGFPVKTAIMGKPL
ncbi:GNAT family N-acetyltransferase [Peribacillus cavernae]|uniref:GNAT family N-acetyltransferase n=1 Tax=Peribacillus cavernae TaxID=1674310 RepID=A0A433HFZ1_9BACI|nr:GNAT family N-acetyltransferase [Peribacillus cavernae]MDQ0219818.1 ribosomal protein S18 acetylase RimI-like enzyme [Peribacillus cavernae]RUQ27209.1 GNAT family N-acetyltransferase [Peribacillus cavernae]